MADSLKYGGIELLSGAGGIYHIADGQRGLGDPQAIVASVRAQLTMGSAVVGRFTDNRHVTLTVVVTASNRPSLSVACEALAYQVDQPVNTLVWTPNGGLPTVFDTWRGQVTATWSAKFEAADARVMQITFDALPFGRSDVQTVISGSSGSIALADFSTPANFTYKTVSSSDGTLYPDLLTGVPANVASVPMPTTGATQAAVTTGPVPVEGTASTQLLANFYKSADAYSYTTLGSSQSPPQTVNVAAQGEAAATVTPTGAVALDLSAATSIVAALFSYSFSVQGVFLKLTDNTSATKVFAMPSVAQSTPSNQWNKYQVSIAGSSLDLTHITGWTLTVVAGRADYTTGMAATALDVGELRAFPASSTSITTASGATLKLANVPGSAQANATIQLDRGGTNTMSNFAVYRAPRGSTAPALVPLTGASSPYTGSTTAPSVLSGTYKVVLGANNANPAIAAGLVLTITQKVNGTTLSGGTKTLTTAGASASMNNLGEVTFPFVEVPSEANNLTYGFSWNGTGAVDVLLFDTRGFLVLVPSLTAAKYIWVDEATALQGMGGVWAGNASDRSDAVSLLSASGLAIAGSFSVDPGDNYLTAWCSAGTPNIKTSFYPRWLHERSA